MCDNDNKDFDIEKLKLTVINTKNNIDSDGKIDSVKEQSSDKIPNDDEARAHTNDAPELEKKELSKSEINITDYLRNEFTSIKVVDLKEDQAKIDTNRRKYSRRNRRPHSFLRGPIVVQFMGSETIPDEREGMIYEPETRNYTVKVMFLVLMVMHYVEFGLVLVLRGTATTVVNLRKTCNYLALPALAISLTLMFCTICMQDMRVGCRLGLAVFGTMISICIFYVGWINVFHGGFYLYRSMTFFFTDITLMLVGCTKFDYTSKILYLIALISCLLWSIFTVPTLTYPQVHYIYMGYIMNWDETPKVFTEYAVAVVINMFFTAIQVAELQFLLDGDSVEIAEDDYMFGAYLLYISPIDFPVRILRKKGYLDAFDTDEEE